MITKKIMAIGTIIFLIGISITVAGDGEKKQETVELNFSFHEPVIASKTISGQCYHSVMMKNLSVVANIGEPRLPAKFVNILLPPDSQVEEIKVTASKKISLGKGYHVEP